MKHLCEIIWNFEEMSFIKETYIFSSGGHFVWQSGTIRAILVENRIRDIWVKLF